MESSQHTTLMQKHARPSDVIMKSLIYLCALLSVFMVQNVN